VKIRIAVHRYRPEVGGTEQMAENLATAMVRKGHEVEVLTLRTADTAVEEELAVAGGGRYRVRRLEYLGGRLRLPVGYWKALAEPTDLIHVFGNRIWCSDLFLPVARRLPAKTVLTGQNFYQLYMHPSPWNEFYFRSYFPWAASHVDHYVVQTHQEEEQLRRFGYRGPISLIPHTVDVEEFDVDPAIGAEFRARHALGSEPVLLSAGGYAPNKRMDRVLEAAARSGVPWRVVITGRDWPGQPYELARCRSLARELGLPVLFLGEGRPVDRVEVLGAFFACTVYAQGSSYEGYGGAIQEAMTVRKPFVAFETGAVPEFAAAGAGFCVRTVDDFARALVRLAGDPEIRDRMGAAGREDVLRARSKTIVMTAYDRLFRALTAS
jgi:glycosyltransferase involved in cell wall biosynthesis